MKCPKTGFMCDESQKYKAKLMMSDGRQIMSEGIVEVKGMPLLFCDKCKNQVSFDSLINNDAWIKLSKDFTKNNQLKPIKDKSFLRWEPLPRLQ